MSDQSYYEDYVTRGHDFYIIISKDKKSLKSSKYAVVRKGLLDFEVFDANDSYSRKFSDKETNLLYKPVQAIVGDRPPKNFLWKAFHKKVDIQETVEWLKTQSKITREFIEGRIPELRFINKTPKEIIKYIFEVQYSINNRISETLTSASQEYLLNIAKELIDLKYSSSNYYILKMYLCKNLSTENILIFKDDKDARVRAAVAKAAGSENASQFFTDRSTLVVENAAKQAEIKTLLVFLDKTKSSIKRKVRSEERRVG